jgi:hypothetical protein
MGAYNARTDADLEHAGQHFARAVVILGISTIQAILMRGQGRSVAARGKPKVYDRLTVADPPAAGNQLKLSRPGSLRGGSLGQTDAFGAIKISRDQSISEQRITLYHELVHRFFSPRVGPFLKFRAELRMSGYVRSAFLRYVEEALAEGYGQLRVHGLAQAIQAWRFPMQGGYVVVSQLVAEGQALGTIALGGITFQVSLALGEMPDE